MKKIFFLQIFLFLSLTLFSQISEGGLPPSFLLSEKKSIKEINPYKIELKQDVNKLIYEDDVNSKHGIPIRIAVVIPAKYDLAKDGEWTKLDKKTKICRLSISSPGAKGIILSYDKFYIPYGGKLFIYSKDKGQILGAYSHRTNPNGKEFSTEIIYGDELILEYVDPMTGQLPQIKIKDIGYAYNNTFSNSVKDVQSNGFTNSGKCEVNINCEEGQNWQLQKKGVACSFYKDNYFWTACSGSLINNVNQDKTAFYLSAYHCYFMDGRTMNFDMIQFYFNYEFPGCSNSTIYPITTKTIVGAQLVVYSPIDGGSDMALLKLNSEIPIDYDVYFNGWDVTNNPAKSGVTIHHPQGDVKKISTYSSPLISGRYDDGTSKTNPNADWITRFSETKNGHGVTEGGSSGGSLFNQDGLIVGTLTGGSSSCNNRNGIEYYGKMWYHWDQHENTKYHLQPYLDPTNKVKKLNGLSNIPSQEKKAQPAYAYWDDNAGKSNLIIQLTDKDDKIKHLTVVNLRGYNAYKKSEGFTTNIHSIPSMGWAKGVYIVHIGTEKGIRHSFKIIR